eukprot:scaffold22574_cov125-Cylindrotheca_fusiformis.AAC.8
MIRAAKSVFKADHECPLIPFEPRKDEGNEIAVVACGEAFARQERFQQMEGVDRIVLGYTGGKREKPTFTKIHDHTEALLIEFNPHKVSFSEILQRWHECHDNPWEKEKHPHHRSAVFWISLAQQDAALEFIEELRASNPSKQLYSEVERARRFYRAKQLCPELSLEPKFEGNETAVFACGDFVVAHHHFQATEGIDRVITAYAGGKRDIPKHHKPYDHAEAVFVEFDPNVISYRQLLNVWHECDNPWEEQIPQHRSIVFWKILSQQDAALEYIAELQANNPKKKLYSDVERVRKVYEVEVYDANADDLFESPRFGRKEAAPQAPVAKDNTPEARQNGEKP